MTWPLKFALHLFLVFCAFLLAYELRRGLALAWWMTNPQVTAVVVWATLYTAIAGVIELAFRTERSSWRFSSARDVVKLARSTGLTAALFLVAIFLSSRAISLPRSTLVLSWLLSLFALVGIRLAWRMRYDRTLASSFFSERRRTGMPLTLVGDLGQAESYLRHWAAGADRQHNPLSIIALDGGGVGQFIQGVRVVGSVNDLRKTLTSLGPERRDQRAVLFLDDPIKRLGLTAETIGWLRAQGYRLLRQTSTVELGGAEAGLHLLREIRLEEFLPRAPLTLESEQTAALVAGKRVLVTGAGGSIGSEIARQLVAYGCAHISLLDHSEFLLFEIDRELDRTPERRCTRSAILCDVRDEARIREVFATEGPDIVFHAAALKHVTLVENNPCEGVLTNIVGTWNVASAARECGAAQMVMISTDKAVSPTNVMGATKRLAEALLPGHGGGNTGYCVVRFGNVLGSAGSVVPIFADQIERGGPVTVTHADVERFFITIPEAVQLVLHAAALRCAGSKNGLRTFVLEMGKPVKIIDLARQMIELNGQIPGIDIEIKITGLRPGEKMTEELIDESELAQPCVPGINEIKSLWPERLMDRRDVQRVAELAQLGNARGVYQAVFECLSSVRGGPTTEVDPVGPFRNGNRSVAERIIDVRPQVH